MDCRRLYILLLLILIAECTISKPEKKKSSKIKDKAEDKKIASESEPGLDKEAISKLITSLQDSGELDDKEVATFYNIMDKMKGNLEIFSAKHEEVDALKLKFQTQIKGLEKLHAEMQETQRKMGEEQAFMDQQYDQFHKVQKDLKTCQDDFKSFEAERNGWEKELSRFVRELKLTDGNIQEEKQNIKTCQQGLTEARTENSQLKEQVYLATKKHPCRDTDEMDKEKQDMADNYEKERQKLVDRVANLQAELDNGADTLDSSRDAVIKRKDERIAFSQEEKMRLIDNHRATERRYQTRLQELQQKFEEMTRTGPSAAYIQELQENVKELDGKTSFLQAESVHIKEQYSKAQLLNNHLTKSVTHWNMKYVDSVKNYTKLEEECADIQLNNNDLLSLLNSNKAELVKLKEEHKNSMSIRDVAMARVKEIDKQCKKDTKAFTGKVEKCTSELSEAVSSLKACQDESISCKNKLEESDTTISENWKRKVRVLQQTIERLENKQKIDHTVHEQTRSSLKEQSTESSICRLKLETTSKALAQRNDVVKDLSKNCSTLGKCERANRDLQTLYDKALEDCHCEPIEEVGEEGETVINRFEIVGGIPEKLKTAKAGVDEQVGDMKTKLSEQYKVIDELRQHYNDVMEKYIKCKGDVETTTLQQKTLLEENNKFKKEIKWLESQATEGQQEGEGENRKLGYLQNKLVDAKEEISNCQETLAVVREKQTTCAERLQTLQTEHSDMIEECEELYNDYKKCNVENQQLDIKAKGVDMIVQKMEEGHQKKMTKVEQKLHSADQSKMELVWFLLVAVMFCIIFGYYSCYSYFRNKYPNDSGAMNKPKTTRDTKKRR